MKFTLHYRGPLKPNGNPDHKQALRRSFHAQLRDLWGRNPLMDQRAHFLNPAYALSVI